MAFGVRRDQPLLLAILDKNLMQIPADTLQSLRDEWIVDRSNLIDAVNDNRMPPQTTAAGAAGRRHRAAAGANAAPFHAAAP